MLDTFTMTSLISYAWREKRRGQTKSNSYTVENYVADAVFYEHGKQSSSFQPLPYVRSLSGNLPP